MSDFIAGDLEFTWSRDFPPTKVKISDGRYLPVHYAHMTVNTPTGTILKAEAPTLIGLEARAPDGSPARIVAIESYATLAYMTGPVGVMLEVMREEPGNLADPDFEPTDEQLIGISQRAFAGLPERRHAIDEKVRADIRAARVKGTGE